MQITTGEARREETSIITNLKGLNIITNIFHQTQFYVHAIIQYILP